MNNKSSTIYCTDNKIFMNLPRTFFGNNIYSLDTKEIKCIDLPKVTQNFDLKDINTYLPFDKISKNELKINFYENMSIIRIFFNIDKWHVATINSIDASKNIYRTNRNIKMKYNKNTFVDLLNKYKKFTYKKLDKTTNYFYGLIAPELFMTNIVKTGHAYPLIEYSLISKKYKLPDKSAELPVNINQNVVYTIGVSENSTHFYRNKNTIDYLKRRKIISNIPNIYYIFATQISNYVEFVKLFPFWKSEIDQVKSELVDKINVIISMYRILFVNQRKKVDLRKKYLINFIIKNQKQKKIQYWKSWLNDYTLENLVDIVKSQHPVYMIFVNKIHESWLLNKIEIKYKTISKIIYNMDALSALIPKSEFFTY